MGVRLYSSNGKPLTLSSRLGEGGEGAVYLSEQFGNDRILKVYKESASPQKKKKLESMIAAQSAELLSFTAWPTDAIYDSKGRLFGFVMPRVKTAQAIHKLYSPAHRKTVFPSADWSFLLRSGRNLSAAFDAVHRHGHVVGDVNQGNVLVNEKALVSLIDCDSFQFRAKETSAVYRCEVGVLEFTPPELQGVRSFRDIDRSPNHDLFGLAVLLFQLLFMGRHPYVGIYDNGRGDMPLERAIPLYYFAYSPTAKTYKTQPPPKSLSFDSIPSSLQSKFELAFQRPSNGDRARPTAKEWRDALHESEQALRRCNRDNSHRYFGSSCPWCNFEEQFGLIFFLGSSPIAIAPSQFNLSTIRSRLNSLRLPGAAPYIDPAAFSAKPIPLPPGSKKSGGAIVGFIWLGAVILTCVAPAFWFIFLGGAGFLSSILNDKNSKKLAAWEEERQRRQDALRTAEYEWNRQVKEWEHVRTDKDLRAQWNKLNDARATYEGLNGELVAEKDKLKREHRNLQLKQFLDQFFLSNAQIRDIGEARKIVLRSHGIETAADVEYDDVTRIRGFGDHLARQLLDWRHEHEKKFQFQPTKPIPPQAIQSVERKIQQKRESLENELRSGVADVERKSALLLKRRAILEPQVRKLANQLAQARADVKVL